MRWVAGVSTAATRQGGGARWRWPRACTPLGRRRSPRRCGGGRPAGLGLPAAPPRADPGRPARRAAPSRCGTTSRPSTIWARASWPPSRCGAPSAIPRRWPSPASACARADETGAEACLRGAWANLSRWGLTGLAIDAETPARPAARGRRPPARHGRDDARAGRAGRRLPLRLDPRRLLLGPQLQPDGEDARAGRGRAPRIPSRRWLVEAARDQWHWVLGRNPSGSSMVTGVGRGPTRIYHLEWGAREPPPPGFLIGGPNAKDMGFLAPGTPAKALLWDNPRPAPLRTARPLPVALAAERPLGRRLSARGELRGRLVDHNRAGHPVQRQPGAGRCDPALSAHR